MKTLKDFLHENYASMKDAEKYANDKVKKHRDSLDGIEIWQYKNGEFTVNHTMNSMGRNGLKRVGAKLIKTVYKK